MSFDMDEKEFYEHATSGGFSILWSAYEDALQERDTARKQLREISRLIWQYAGIDGAHHKQWVFDQIIRVLAGHDEKKYNELIENYCEGEHGPDTYEWDQGIAP